MHLLIKNRHSIRHNVPAFQYYYFSKRQNKATASIYLRTYDVDRDTGVMDKEYIHV